MITARRPSRPLVAVFGAAAVALAAGCTSSSDGGATGAATSGAPSSSGASNTPPTPTPSSGATTSAPARPTALDGAVVVAGTDPASADVYAIRGGRAVRLTRDGGYTGVTRAAGTTVVAREAGGHEEVLRLRPSGGTDALGVPSGFSPALSPSGRLAYVALGGSSTPGITKPGGSTITVRPSPTGRGQVVATFPGSVGDLGFRGGDVVAAVADGAAARVVDVATSGRTITLARVRDADDLDLAVGARTIAVVTGTGGVLVPLGGGTPVPLAAGWTPLCWSGAATLVVHRGARLATVAVRGGVPAAPRSTGPLPGGLVPLAAACG